MILRTCDPSAFITNRSVLPPLSPSNTIHCPSAENIGASTKPAPEKSVSAFLPVPSALTTAIC